MLDRRTFLKRLGIGAGATLLPWRWLRADDPPDQYERLDNMRAIRNTRTGVVETDMYSIGQLETDPRPRGVADDDLVEGYLWGYPLFVNKDLP